MAAQGPLLSEGSHLAHNDIHVLSSYFGKLVEYVTKQAAKA